MPLSDGWLAFRTRSGSARRWWLYVVCFWGSAYQHICRATHLEALGVESLTSMRKLNVLLPLGCYMILTSHIRSGGKRARGGEKCGESWQCDSGRRKPRLRGRIESLGSSWIHVRRFWVLDCRFYHSIRIEILITKFKSRPSLVTKSCGGDRCTPRNSKLTRYKTIYNGHGRKRSSNATMKAKSSMILYTYLPSSSRRFLVVKFGISLLGKLGTCPCACTPRLPNFITPSQISTFRGVTSDRLSQLLKV